MIDFDLEDPTHEDCMGIVPSPLGLQDAGADRERLRADCPETWCELYSGHPGPCLIAPQRVMERNEFGPREAVQSRRAHVAVEGSGLPQDASAAQGAAVVSGSHTGQDNTSGGKP